MAGCFVSGVLAVAVGLEADRVDAGVDLRHAEDLLDLVLRVALGDVDGLAAERRGLLQARLDEVADDHDRRAEQLGGVGGGEADRARAGDVDGAPGLHARGHAAVVAGREDVRQHRQVEDLLHRLRLVGELEAVEVRVRDHHVLGLAADPAAHVDVAVRRAGPLGVHGEADAGVLLLAVATAPAGDVERHGHEVALVEELDVAALLDHLAGDLVPEDQPLGRGRAAADHVLVRAADVRRDDPEDHSVVALAADVLLRHTGAFLDGEAREVDGLDLDLPGAHVGNPSVVRHVPALPRP